MFTNPDFFPEGQTIDSAPYSIAATAKGAGVHSIGDAYCAEAAQCSSTVFALKAASQQLGLDFAYSASISASAPNYTTQCVAASQTHLASVFLASVTAVTIRFGVDCLRRGYNPTYLSRGEGFGMGWRRLPA
jgi:branched-chain amino acid transport system substrate-binding protein